MAAGTDEGVSILWNEGTMAEWSSLYGRVRRSTLPQSFAYAQAMGKTHGHVPRLGLIRRGGATIGLVQILERRFLKIFQQRQMHRGPLWLDGLPEPAVLEETFRLLRKACPDNLLNRASLLPELPAGPQSEELLRRCGFRPFGPGYRTVWLDLARGEEDLRAGFARDWRQRLKGAEKSGLAMDMDWEAKNLPWLMKQEQEQALAKGFRPMTGRLAVRLRNALVKKDGVLIATALDRGAPVACALVYVHGAAATYQIGWANETGRKADAMRLVLWRTVQALKRRRVTSFDLGGINPESAPGVTEFKLGTGGDAIETVGLYR